jgi:hypothetical protein
MRADIGFGWIVFLGFLLWVLQVLRAGSRGTVRRGAPPPMPGPQRPDASQREGEQLEEMLRQLQGRLGQARGEAGTGTATRGNTTIVVKRPAPVPGPVRPRTPARPRPAGPTEAPEGASLEVPVDREAEAEALERHRLEAVAARNRELTDADHAAFEARMRQEDAAPRARTAARRLTPRQLREAFVWNEILGPPMGLRE